MEYIKIHENDINIVFGITESKHLKLLHFSKAPFCEEDICRFSPEAAPSEKGYSTVNDNPEAIAFSWECKTTPVEVVVDGFDCKPTATMTIDSREADPAKFAELEKILYGEGETEGRLPLPTEVINLFKGASA